MNEAVDRVLEDIEVESSRRLQELCAISSESGNTEGLRRVAAVLSSELASRGLSVEIVDEADAYGKPQPVLIARGPDAGKGHLLLIGHMDTVLPAIEPRVEEGRMLATGAYDMKGGLAMFVGALDVLKARGQKFPDDLILVLVPDEESESFISGSAMARWSENARAVLVLEPGQRLEGGETLVAGRRGLIEWKLEVTGRASHSGVAYWSGRSALVAAAHWCVEAQALSKRGSGPTVNVSRIVGGTADFVADLAQHHTMVGTSRQLNVVSDRALAEGEVRFLSIADGPAMLEELERLTGRVCERYEVTAVFTPGMRVPPVDPNGPGAPLVQRVVDLAKARGYGLEVEQDRGGISFPNFIADPTRTPVIDGLGPTGEGMHIRGEYLNLDSLGHRIVLLADLLATL